MANACKNCGSHLGFFAALLMVVAAGGATYLYLNSSVFSVVEEQQQTAAANPGRPHPPKTIEQPKSHPASKPAANAAE